MGNKEARLQAKKSVSSMLDLEDEKQQRELWKSFLEGPIKPDVVHSSFDNSLIEEFSKRNYKLYILLVSDTIEYLFAAALKHDLSSTESLVISKCISVLYKFLPPVLSLPHISHYIFWENHIPPYLTEEEAYDVYSNKVFKGPSVEETKEIIERKAPLGLKLIQGLINLLFKQEYTISALDEEERKSIDPYSSDIKLIWSGGLQFVETKQHKVRKFDQNRIDVLKLLLMCLGSQLYNPNNTIFNYFSFCAANGAAPFLKSLFYSLFNTVLTYTWKGYGIPFASSRRTPYDTLVDLSMQVLSVLVEYRPPSETEIEDLIKTNRTFAGIASFYIELQKEEIPMRKFATNEFQRLLEQLEGLPNFKTIYEELVKLLDNFILVSNTALPYSVKEFKCENELMIFVLRLMVLNPHFTNYVLLREELKGIVLPLLYMFNKSIPNPQKIQLTSTLAFILLNLSSRPEFGIFLNREYKETVTFDLPLFQGQYQDLLILLLHKALREVHLSTPALRQAFLSILFNISPFVKNITMQSVAALTQLVTHYTNPAWLLKDSDSFLPVKIVLDSIHNMLIYNYSSNPVLAFALLNQSKKYITFMEARLTDLVSQQNKAEEEKMAKEDTIEDNNVDKRVEERKETTWTPSEQWLTENKAHLPLKQILGILVHVSNRLERAYMVYEATEEEILTILKRSSILGIQEDILKFAPLRFLLTPDINAWLSGYLWKTLFIQYYSQNMFITERIRYILIFSQNEPSPDIEEEKVASHEVPEEKIEKRLSENEQHDQ